MDYMRLAKWLAIVVLVLYLVLKGSLVFTIPLRTLATVYDTGPYGYTRLVETLRNLGNSVYLNLPDPRLPGDKVLLVLDPLFCTPGYVRPLAAWVSEANPRLIAVVGSSPCALRLAETLSGAYALTRFISNASVELDGITGYSSVQAVMEVRGAEPIGRAAGVYAAGFNATRVVYIAAADMLRNRWLEKRPENAEALARLLGCSNGGCIIIIPSALETGSISASVSLYPLALALASMLAMLERSLYKLLDGLLAVAYTLAAGALIARYALRGAPRSGVEPIPSTPEPPSVIAGTEEYRAVAERGWKAIDPKTLIIRLYEVLDAALRYRLGVGVEQALRSEEAIAKLAGLTGLKRDEIEATLSRIHRLKRRARRETIWPPLVLWGRAARDALVKVDELLKRLGVGLTDLRSLEVALEYAEYRRG